ncbi:hypothetical protein KIN20_025948 [Parelaphostrongylus tenuis]|uniref:alkaline phosphatase n=1 Tax=Parelaphostrongylus tenuis TaxID=148309 RepID=A0AAD5QX87_PARTN|nr:hypothetical protein KIN20_025948 [Parelaphostrongylus tenuis]
MALFTGWKVNTGTLGMKPTVKERCTNSSDLHVTDGIVEGVLQKGMGVGFVTTTRITHATPAALYAKGVDRNHEFDDPTMNAELKCTHDIAKQLLSYPASEFKVTLTHVLGDLGSLWKLRKLLN